MAQPQPPYRNPYQPPQQNGMQYNHGGYPPQRVASPVGIQPPSKRPRLESPSGPTSPYSQYPQGQSQHPQQYGSHLSPVNAQSPFHHHSPAPAVQAPYNPAISRNGNMGPPAAPNNSRPQKKDEPEKEKPTNPEDFTDILALAGIDQKAEEEKLTNYMGESYSSNTASQSTSFGPPYGQLPPGTGPLASQQPGTERGIENEVVQRHKEAARLISENHAKALNNPFLSALPVRSRIERRAFEMGIKLDVDGLFDPIKVPSEPSPQSVAMVDAEQKNGIVSVKQHSLLNDNTAFADILSLLSLAANERIRGLVEDAFRLSRNRQVSADGVVTPGFQKIATGYGEPKNKEVVPLNVTRTPWEDAPGSAVSPMTLIPSKRPADNSGPTNLPTPPTDPPYSPQQPIATIQFPNATASALTDLYRKEQEFERKRIAAREKRKKVAEAAAKASADNDDAPIEDIKPAEPKMTKKQREALAKAGQTEDVLHRQANATASLALGGKSRYSWMTAGGGAPARGGIGTGAGVGRGAGGVKREEKQAKDGENQVLVAKGREFGTWREDSEKAKMIVARDWLAVLERDGMERKAMVKLVSRMGNPNLFKGGSGGQGGSGSGSQVGTPGF